MARSGRESQGRRGGGPAGKRGGVASGEGGAAARGSANGGLGGRGGGGAILKDGAAEEIRRGRRCEVVPVESQVAGVGRKSKGRRGESGPAGHHGGAAGAGGSAAASGSASDGWVVALAVGTRDGVAEVVRQGIVCTVIRRVFVCIFEWLQVARGQFDRPRRYARNAAAKTGNARGSMCGMDC